MFSNSRHVLLIQPPATTNVVMLVEARIPGRAPPEGFPVYGKACGVYRQCGFVWDKTGATCGGNAWHRPRREDDTVDNYLTIDGTLTKTDASPRRRPRPRRLPSRPRNREEVLATDLQAISGESDRRSCNFFMVACFKLTRMECRKCGSSAE